MIDRSSQGCRCARRSDRPDATFGEEMSSRPRSFRRLRLPIRRTPSRGNGSGKARRAGALRRAPPPIALGAPGIGVPPGAVRSARPPRDPLARRLVPDPRPSFEVRIGARRSAGVGTRPRPLRHQGQQGQGGRQPTPGPDDHHQLLHPATHRLVVPISSRSSGSSGGSPDDQVSHREAVRSIGLARADRISDRTRDRLAQRDLASRRANAPGGGRYGNDFCLRFATKSVQRLM